MDLSKTVNLMKTDFPMKANLPLVEPDIVDFWEENRIYYKVLAKNQGREQRILHDGPPYSNGKIHLGHALNKILKDILVKYWNLKGYYSPFIPGWDTHGLPNEKAALTTYNIDRKKVSELYIREKSKEIAVYYSEIQKNQFRRLGVFADWENPYLTLNPSYEAAIIRAFGKLWQNGYIYREMKPVYWCYDCETSLAEAEIEYKEKSSPSIVVSFKLEESLDDIDQAYVLIWTTTPWTLPANVAIAYKPDSQYILVDYNSKKYIVAKEAYFNAEQLKFLREESRIVKELSSDQLFKLKAKHPFIDRYSILVPADYVDLYNGTGLVHIAPGHGYEDYITGKKFGLQILSPVDQEGKFTDEVELLKGLHIDQANQVITKILSESGSLLWQSSIIHSYPHCWRCHKPVIFRATYQWFLDVEKMKDKLISSIGEVEWYPSWGRERMVKMVENRPDWCLSRQRVWGVFIPALYCKNCKEHIIDNDIVENIASIIEKEGSDVWWKKDVKYFINKDLVCSKCGSREFEKEKDIFDVWFESAVSHLAVLYNNLPHPCELYLEGADQYRGWFQVSLITSVGVLGYPPYKKVLTHGWVLDSEGRAMHKSLGNVIDPMEIVEEYGADILRLYFATSEYVNDIKMSKNTLNVVAEMYKKIRNTIRFMLGNIYDFDIDTHKFNLDELPILEKYILYRHARMIKSVENYIENFEFHRYIYEVYNYIVHSLSALYLDIRKDVLYTYERDSFARRACQFVIFNILRDLLVMLFPVLSFTCEQAWRNIPLKNLSTFSCYLQDWPDYKKYSVSGVEFVDDIIELQKAILPIFEKYKNSGQIKTTNESILHLYSDKAYEFLETHKDIIKEIFRVAEVAVSKQNKESLEFVNFNNMNVFVEFIKSNYHKCQRCWNYYPELRDYNIKVCFRCYDILQKIGMFA
ncbi:MAG: isoleucine--tRNA ligase [Candidatus Calescibacterium sp.]|nr:isoleucine--tRNA ligase [Candidatus Calescibacterium sp.]MCX7972417.1 isoleucine--tRNA ligase [bacterium]MDW8195692.1 isoleucine--tRNA ligase [Candidatus Calescibacterium sp.]